MRRLVQEISVEILKYNELSKIEKEILRRAMNIRLHAQAPYSHYWVGCSILVDHPFLGGRQQRFFDGCNVENVNWSETIHGEENAISTAIAELGPCKILMVGVIGAPENRTISWPAAKHRTVSSLYHVGDICPSCGHCLQIIAENCFDKEGKFDPNIPLLGYNEPTAEIYRTKIGDAYPMPFLPQHLGINYTNDPRFKY